MKAKDMWYVQEPVNPRVQRKIQITEVCKEINKFGKAIDSPARYLILEALSKSPKSVGQLTKIINISQPGTSQHLKLLQHLGFIDGFKNGKQITYKLNPGYILKMSNKISDLIKKRNS